jgi:hypothetical protein
MRWTGKIVGGVIGAFVLGPIGAAVGALLGHQFDANSAALPWETRPRSAAVPDGNHFFRVTFEVMGHLAKADGRVHCRTGHAELAPNERSTLSLPIEEAPGMMRAGPPSDAESKMRRMGVWGGAVDLSHIVAFQVFLPHHCSSRCQGL